MTIVTLTSDYGTTDHYVAALKGHVLTRVRDVKLVDVSHDISSFNIVQAAFVLRHAFPAFPAGTIHCVIVHSRTSRQRLLCIERKGHYFLVPDNGMATLMFDELDACREVTLEHDQPNWQQRLAACIQVLGKGEGAESLGPEVSDYEQRIHLNPVVTNAFIRGSAIYIDNYDNVVFNITRELFESVSKGRKFELYYKRHDPVTEIHQDYYDVPVGEVICRFNDRGFLELGMNMDRAASLLGIKIDDNVQIHFEIKTAKMIRRIVKMIFREEEIAAFKDLFEQTSDRIRSFEGCQSLELVQGVDDPRVFFTISTWRDAEALESYRNSDLFKSTWSQTKVKFDDRPAAWSTQTIKMHS